MKKIAKTFLKEENKWGFTSILPCIEILKGKINRVVKSMLASEQID